jgi:hypothetical protein
MAKAAFKKKNNLFTSKLDSTLRKKLVKCYIWSIVVLKSGHFGKSKSGHFGKSKSGHFGKSIRNTWKVLKYSAGEEWRRSVGVILW